MPKIVESPNYLQKLERKRNDEEFANARKIKEWFLPLLESKNLANKSLKEVVLVSVGCGLGADVDEFVDLGIDAYGVEPFSRTRMWYLRKNKDRLIVADGENLPFKDKFFDVVYCLEVIEHVTRARNVWDEREKFAKELTRILKFGGAIILTTPNRLFCADIGHQTKFSGIRIHSPFNDFTLSFKDIKNLFLRKAGCTSITTLPYENFITWDLYKKNYPAIRPLFPLFKTYFRLLDKHKFLKSSFLSPHLILAIKK